MQRNTFTEHFIENTILISEREPLGTSDHPTIGFDVFWQIKRGSSMSRI